MRVTVVGAHGKVARMLDRDLVNNGHEVAGVIRSPAQRADLEEDGVTPVLLDLESATSPEYAQAFDGSDAVVFAAGAGGGNVEKTYAIDRDAAIAVIDAATSAGVVRFVMLSTTGSGHPEIWDDGKEYLIAKGQADDHLKRSALDWTIVRPTYLSDDTPAGSVSLGDPDKDPGPAVSRADVAAVLAAVLDHPNTIGKAFTVDAGDIPIDEAVSQI